MSDSSHALPAGGTHVQLPFKPVTHDFLALVKRETGYAVRLVEEPKSPALSRVQLARDSAPVHCVSYRPADDESVDYLICYQCGFLLRLFDNPPDARYEFVPSEKGRTAVRRLIADQGRTAKAKRAAASALEETVTTFLHGLLDRLYAVPVGLRVAEWILENFPELEAGQRSAVLREVADAQATLEPELRARTPTNIFDAMQAINAAQALYWAERHGVRELAAPFRTAGYQRAGRALLDIWRDSPSDPGYDRELVDRWANELQIAGWGSWQRYVAPLRVDNETGR
jgi:hypothetical protein